MINYKYIPEILDWCKEHYVPPIKEHIHCSSFGDCDGMDGSCHWCREMFPYQWHMCYDENWVRSLLSPVTNIPVNSREEAAEFIEKYKQEHYT